MKGRKRLDLDSAGPTDAMLPHLEDVFKTSGVPSFTFVETKEYDAILVALRTPGKGVVIEGPTGVGKSTAVTRALESLKKKEEAIFLSARRISDLSLIGDSSFFDTKGIIIVDDFHRLPDFLKTKLTNQLKLLADEDSYEQKLVLLGINRAGDTLFKLAPDLLDRISRFKLCTNPDYLIKHLIELGSEALNIRIFNINELAAEALGSFQIAQGLCFKACILSKVFNAQETPTPIRQSVELVREQLLDEYKGRFLSVVRQFSIGTRLRARGRAPYLHLLKWLSESEEWCLDISSAVNAHSNRKGSVSQVVDKGFLTSFLRANADISDLFHFDEATKTLSCEDPKLFYFLKHLNWNGFAKSIGYVTIDFKAKYDIALSFSGADRDVAEELKRQLASEEIEVFYDRDEESRILAEEVAQYLGPIYRSESRFVVVLMGKTYPSRIWTAFESDVLKERLGDGSVIPVLIDDHSPSSFDPMVKVGYFTIARSNLDADVKRLVNLLLEKIEKARRQESVSPEQLSLQFGKK